MIDAVFAQKDRDEWEEIFKAQDVWHQPVLSAAVSATTLASGLHTSCVLCLAGLPALSRQPRCQCVTAGLSRRCQACKRASHDHVFLATQLGCLLCPVDRQPMPGLQRTVLAGLGWIVT